MLLIKIGYSFQGSLGTGEVSSRCYGCATSTRLSRQSPETRFQSMASVNDLGRSRMFMRMVNLSQESKISRGDNPACKFQRFSTQLNTGPRAAFKERDKRFGISPSVSFTCNWTMLGGCQVGQGAVPLSFCRPRNRRTQPFTNLNDELLTVVFSDFLLEWAGEQAAAADQTSLPILPLHP